MKYDDKKRRLVDEVSVDGQGTKNVILTYDRKHEENVRHGKRK